MNMICPLQMKTADTAHTEIETRPFSPILGVGPWDKVKRVGSENARDVLH